MPLAQGKIILPIQQYGGSQRGGRRFKPQRLGAGRGRGQHGGKLMMQQDGILFVDQSHAEPVGGAAAVPVFVCFATRKGEGVVKFGRGVYPHAVIP